MILKDDFYSIRSLQNDNGSVSAELELNPAHHIYEGHFPGQPVTPGVCMMQMIKEIVETVLERETKLVRADEMKFLLMIIPGENNLVNARLKYSIEEDNGISVTASLLRDTAMHFKFKGLFMFQ